LGTVIPITVVPAERFVLFRDAAAFLAAVRLSVAGTFPARRFVVRGVLDDGLFADRAFGAFAMSGFPPPKNQYGTGYSSESNDPLSVPTSWASLCKLKLKQMPSDRVHSPRQSRRGEAAMTATVQNTTVLAVAMAVVLAIILSPLLGW
jgi:hypothetical protein